MTFADIRIYVEEKLLKHAQMQKMCRLESVEAPKVAGEIVIRAQGIFLWVTLVVRSLPSALTNKDDITRTYSTACYVRTTRAYVSLARMKLASSSVGVRPAAVSASGNELLP